MVISDYLLAVKIKQTKKPLLVLYKLMFSSLVPSAEVCVYGMSKKTRGNDATFNTASNKLHKKSTISKYLRKVEILFVDAPFFLMANGIAADALLAFISVTVTRKKIC